MGLAALAACEACRGGPTSATTKRPAASFAAGDADVGSPTARLYLLTDMAGALEPCGCTKDQLGGLDHFGAWVSGNRARAPQSLVASAGPLFYMEDALTADRAGQDRIKAESIARVLRDLGLAAFAPGANDWADGPSGLDRLALVSGAAVVGAPADRGPRWVMREVGGVKIAFIGVGQPSQTASSTPRSSPSSSSSASPSPSAPAPTASAAILVRGAVDEAKKQGANALVVLASTGRGEAKRIADAVPELAAVVVGSVRSRGEGNTTAPQGERIGNVLIAQAANHLQSVAVLDLYVREPLVPGRIVEFGDATGLELANKREELSSRIDDLHIKIAAWERDPSVAPADVEARRRELAGLEAERESLDQRPAPPSGSFFRYTLKEMRESLGKDPAIEEVMRSYYRAVDEHNRRAFADRVPPPAAEGQATFLGIERCSACHPGARAVWNSTAHSRAYATLSTQYKEFNLECVSCHVTGYEQPAGSTVTHTHGLENVQCEVCHGPGSKHPGAPTDKRYIVAKPEPSVCVSCHHPPHVEAFDATLKMGEILGPGHGRPL
jgi:2',3'-cyclic-nucleotide 2'-phosphodiesterase (5'-nucleotidase family)